MGTALAALAAIVLTTGLASPALADDTTPPPADPTQQPAESSPPPVLEPLLPDTSAEPVYTPLDPPVYGDFSDPPTDSAPWLTSAPVAAPVFSVPDYRTLTDAERSEGSRRSAEGLAWLVAAQAAYEASGMSLSDANAAALADLNAITMRADFDLNPHLPVFRMRAPGEAAPPMPRTTVSRAPAAPAGSAATIQASVAATVVLELHNLAARATVATLSQAGGDPVACAVGPNRTATIRVHLAAGADTTLSISGAREVESGITARFVPLAVDGWEHRLTGL
ncbi:hypothetical protein [Rathayibacter sp. YIM 133350]|uniref:hypothetical protein n=1 Tax=Rathayibacter sp. YIM 133350 TaxID=3131992 RepID=UPI00307EFF9D